MDASRELAAGERLQAAASEIVAMQGVTDEAEAEGSASEATEAAAPEAQEAAQDPFNPSVPDEIAALVGGNDEPDFQAEAEAEVAAEEEETELGAYDDPAVAEERKKRVAAEKRAAYYEQRDRERSQKKWREEISKFYPLAPADRIVASATSRRAALRSAKAEHDRVFAIVQPFVQKTEEVAAETREQLYAQAAESWGKPVSSPHPAPQQSIERTAHEQRVRNAKTLSDRVRIRLGGGDNDDLAGRVFG